MSKLFRLQWEDLVKGLIVSVVGAFLTSVIELLKVGFLFDWRTVALAGVISGLSYLVKNLGTDEGGKVLGKFQL